MREIIIAQIRTKYNSICNYLDERAKRIWAATEAAALGRGGQTIVSQAIGMSRSTIRKACREQAEPPSPVPSRLRRPGSGQKKCIEKDRTLQQDLNNLIDPVTRGDPMNPLRWTTKSIRKLVQELTALGHKVGITTVRKLLKQMGYSLQANRKTREGENHPDRNEQFLYINEQAEQYIAEGQPVISVDTKKKENIGNFSNKGREYQPKGKPIEVNMHDFPDKELGKAIPYGIYDIANNKGYVNVGIDNDTAEFAVNGIRRWWEEMGRERFGGAKKLLITADGGGSNSYRGKLWKRELKKLADEMGLEITVCHFPPGTSKWNKIEHRLFSYISKNWRAEPLRDMATVVNLISNTTTATGLKVHCVVDNNSYEKGIKISDKELKSYNITPHDFHGEWNYTINKTG
jgi:transposase